MMEIQKYSTLTCPNCGHQKTEEMPTDGCQFFYECETAKPFCAQNPVTAVCFVRTEV